MNDTWQKIKFWARITLFSVIALYVIGFFIANRNAYVTPAIDFIFHTWTAPNLLLVLILDSVFSIFGWWLFRTVFRALRQMQQMRATSRTGKLEREVADMKNKAAMLQVKPATPADPTPPGA
jgi:hypothetical protein